MKALTICQPYAEAICRGLKRVENRGWLTYYRGPLLIHAGKSKKWLESWSTASCDWRDFLAFGAIVGRAQLVNCGTIAEVRNGLFGQDLRYHEHASGPHCLILDEIERLERPIPCRGRQGLFDVDLPALAAAVGYPLIWYPAGPPARYCRVCGCTEHTPCHDPQTGTCYWVERGESPADLCSACAREKE